MLKMTFDESKKRQSDKAEVQKMSLDALHAHQLFDPKSLRSLTYGLNEETRTQLLRLEDSGPLRRLMIVPNDYSAKCRALEARFPNFSAYINDYLLPSLALAHVRKSSFQLPPTVFVGSPGVGKTLFVSALAETFLLEFERVNLETSQASMEFVGTARGWSNAQPGLLFRWLLRSEFANGIFVMEELDKADDKNSRSPIANSLLQLLEPTTSKSFSDLSVPDLKLDLSKLNFMFTANTLDGIPPAVLSRIMVYEVPDLTPLQAKNVAIKQYEAMLKDLNLPIDAPKLTHEALMLLSSESPRRQRLLLQLAIGSAVYTKSKELVIQKVNKPKKGIGFVI